MAVYTCRIKDCDEPIRSLGFCAKHYTNWHCNGHPLFGELDGIKRARKPKLKERQAWHAAKMRCTKTSHQLWKNYGGRGIKMCEHWLNNFDAFWQDMGRAPDGYSLDRIDVNGNYEPSNCRWASTKQQNRNMRSTVLNPSIVSYAKTVNDLGETITSIASDLDVPYFALYQAVRGVSWQEVRAHGR